MTSTLAPTDFAAPIFLIVTLSSRDGDAPVIHRVEQAGSDPHVAYNFRSPRPIEEIFRPSFAERFREIVAMRDGIGSLLHLPDFVYRSGDLLLSTCQIMVSRSRNALEHVIVRFRRVAGHLREVLTSSLVGAESPLSFARVAASKCLLDIICPLRDIGHHIGRLEDDGTLERSGLIGEALQALGDRIRALNVDGDQLALSLRSLDPSTSAGWPPGTSVALKQPTGRPCQEIESCHSEAKSDPLLGRHACGTRTVR